MQQITPESLQKLKLALPNMPEKELLSVLEGIEYKVLEDKTEIPVQNQCN
jgi:hypothetical protein